MKSAGRLLCVLLMIRLVAPTAAYAQGQALESRKSWLDWVNFGDAESERGHRLETDHSEVIEGAQDTPEFLHLRDAEGRWVISSPEAMRRSGDNAAWTPIWEYAGGVAEGPFPGRFIYVTYPIPREMTQGRTEVTLHLQAVGSSFEHPMQTPSQGIYAA